MTCFQFIEKYTPLLINFAIIFTKKQTTIKLRGMVAHNCNPSTQEDETGAPQVQDQPGLHSKILSQNNKNKQTKEKPDQKKG
jgi:hypothetical protein